MKTRAHRLNIRTLVLVTAAALAAAGPAAPWAASRALLIGVGKYELPNNDLPGVDLDIDNMKKVAQIMGFAPQDTKVLFDEQATYAGVKTALATWLREGINPPDRVLIYFSGHGTRVPDPRPDSANGVDDALVLHDVKPARIGGRASLKNVLIGNEFGAALAAIPSKNILVLVDACHSGTATRSLRLGNLSLGVDTGAIKHFSYPGEPIVVKTRTLKKPADEENYAAVSAAKDDEFAIATSHGGLFTLGVVDAISSASRDGKRPTVAELRSTVAAYIESHTDEQSRHHPVADGNPALIRGALNIISVRDGHGPTWRALEALVTLGDPLTISTPLNDVAIGQEMTFDAPLPKSGFLNVVAIDADDRATVLFPNKYAPSNDVAAGAFRFPTESMNFALRASDPAGPTLVVAFLTDKKVNLLELGVEGRDAAGQLQQTFTEVTARATRAIAVEARHKGFSAGSLTINVNATPPTPLHSP
jgi:hypothetical protein